MLLHQPDAELEQRLSVPLLQFVEDCPPGRVGEGLEHVAHAAMIGKSLLACQDAGEAPSSYGGGMPGRRRDPLLRSSAFDVRIGDREIGFAEVSRLTSESVLDPEGERVHQHAPIVLRRALTSSTDLYAWRRSIVDGKDDRRDVTIRQLSAPGGQAVNSWKLVHAWPIRWSGPEFDALNDDIAWEELELTFDDLLWLQPDTTIGRG
jgi:T4-like virus tail tube protein gp19